MSADNWDVCPQCLDRAKAERQARVDAAAEAYGTVPPEEYERLRTEALAGIAEPDALTFREDYEFYGASKGTVCASYSGHCEVCGLGVDFTYEREFYKGAEQAREETLDV